MKRKQRKMISIAKYINILCTYFAKKLKFVDDLSGALSIATRIKLEKYLVSSADRPTPYTY